MIKVIFTWWSKRVQCLNQSFTLRQVVVLGYILRFLMVSLLSQETVVIVVVVDLLFERIVLATVKTTMPQQVSHRPIKYQSRSWSQRGIQVNRSHYFHKSLLRPTGIQIATKSLPGLTKARTSETH